ncbi:zinc-binding dehydrogenase [Nocardioides currus]|uniref:Alcohol dehydrogenase n=1 Tax=Nocardioides currus TaxID=2133958 RepID=A0A2R7Z1X5_9ACTN|nr:zinc-binding dehydrogenase [Nocardioides currus]PUA82622.1 alcohol dehydrogenase [Nocardioides currus]
MSTTTRAWFQREQDGPLELAEVTLADPGPHAVRVRIQATGVCQSQAYWMGQPRPMPLLFGHEGYGVVEAVGDEVSRTAVGDTVMVTWLPSPESATRAPGRTEATLADGSTAFWTNVSTWQEQTVVDEQYVVTLDEGLRDPAIALVGCAVPTGAGALINAARFTEGDTVAVIGLGGVGLSAVAAASILGAGSVIAIDLTDEKLAFSKQFGATHTVNSGQEDPVAAVKALASGRSGNPGVDAVIDCVGLPSTIAQSVAMAADGKVSLHRGGTVAVVGVPKSGIELDPIELLTKEKALVGTLGGGAGHDQLRLFCDWTRDGRLDLPAMITDTYSFEQVPEAMEALKAGKILGRSIVTID